MNQPQPNQYPKVVQTYIQQIEGHIFEVLESQATSVPLLFLNNKERENYAYAPGKWTLKEMLGHIIDTERVMTYRLAAFARNEQQVQPGFDENDYVNQARFSARSLEDLTAEFEALRKANLYLFRSLNEEEMSRKGIASGNGISVKALLYVIAGHVLHHINILKERYHVV